MPPRAPPAPGPRPPPRAVAAAAAADADAGGAGGPGLRPLAPRPWRWLLLLALPAACSAPPPPPRPVYTNHWAVQVLGGPAAADRVAAAHGYLNLGQVSAAGPARPKLSRPPVGTARGGASFRLPAPPRPRVLGKGPERLAPSGRGAAGAPCRESPGDAAPGTLGGAHRVARRGAHAGLASPGVQFRGPRGRARAPARRGGRGNQSRAPRSVRGRCPQCPPGSHWPRSPGSATPTPLPSTGGAGLETLSARQGVPPRLGGDRRMAQSLGVPCSLGGVRGSRRGGRAAGAGAWKQPSEALPAAQDSAGGWGKGGGPALQTPPGPWNLLCL